MKETKELAVGLVALSAVLVKHFKDGVQLGKDLPAIWVDIQSNEDLKVKLEAAVKDATLIKDEVKTVTVASGFELVAAIGPEIIKLVEEIQKKPEVVS